MTGLKKNREFLTVYKNGKSKADVNLVLYAYHRNEPSEARVGISVSKKVGNSVVRHRIKRRLKEIARLHADAFADGYDYVAVARVRSREADYRALEKSFIKLAGIVMKSQSQNL